MDQATEEIADREENDGGAKEGDVEQGGGIESEEEQIPVNLHGYWVKCHVKDVHVQALENEGTVSPRLSPNGGLTIKLWYLPQAQQRF
jgi:hypothetical protein